MRTHILCKSKVQNKYSISASSIYSSWFLPQSNTAWAPVIQTYPQLGVRLHGYICARNDLKGGDERITEGELGRRIPTHHNLLGFWSRSSGMNHLLLLHSADELENDARVVILTRCVEEWLTNASHILHRLLSVNSHRCVHNCFLSMIQKEILHVFHCQFNRGLINIGVTIYH